MNLSLYIICRDCEHRERTTGRPRCQLSGEWFMVHVRERFCAAGRYPSRGIGDIVAWLAFTPMGRRVQTLFRTGPRKTGACSPCVKRHRQLNGRCAGLAEWARDWKWIALWEGSPGADRAAFDGRSIDK